MTGFCNKEREIILEYNDSRLLLMAERARAAYKENAQAPVINDWECGRIEMLSVPAASGYTGILVYTAKQGEGELRPVFVNIHGGGFIQGSADDDDCWCRKIAESVGCVVVNIDYHLAPEHPFPFALEECYNVLKWIQAEGGKIGVDSSRLAVGGHSAGGNLTAALLCLLARQRREFTIAYQVLNYPPLDFTLDPFSKRSPDKLLTPRVRDFFTACYIKDAAQRKNPLASPLLAENLAGLPAALIISAEHDPLREEAELFAQRLSAAQVEVTYKMFAGCMHAFTHFGPEPQAAEAWALIHAKLKQAFAMPSDRICGG